MEANSILKTLGFFDAQDLPLTLLEIRSYLDCEDVSLSRIEELLRTELSDKVVTDSVFYCLRGREELFQKRRNNYRTSLIRMRKAKRVLYWLRFLPFIRAVAISGSQAILNSRADSDIDIFIVTAKNRIWLARMLVTLYLQAIGQRRHGGNTKDRFCLNHYIDESVKIDRDQNLYTAILYSSFLPVFGKSFFKKFWEQNRWIEDHIKNPVYETTNNFFRYEPAVLQKVLESILEVTLMAPLLNSANRLYQRSRIRAQDYVYVSDSELSFHPDSKGQQILARFADRFR